MSEERVHRSEEWLREKYWGEGLTMVEMGDLAGVSFATIMYHMDKHGVETRGRGRRPIPEEDLRGDLERLASELGHQPGQHQYERMGGYSVNTVRDRLGDDGSWVGAVESALPGYEPPPQSPRGR